MLSTSRSPLKTFSYDFSRFSFNKSLFTEWTRTRDPISVHAFFPRVAWVFLSNMKNDKSYFRRAQNILKSWYNFSSAVNDQFDYCFCEQIIVQFQLVKDVFRNNVSLGTCVQLEVMVVIACEIFGLHYICITYNLKTGWVKYLNVRLHGYTNQSRLLWHSCRMDYRYILVCLIN